MATKKSNKFSVFGTRPTDAIYLPDVPYSVRLNCKDGGLFVGGNEPKNRKTNPEQTVDISIIKVSKFFGSLGKTKNVLWLQLFYVAAPGVDSNILPKNTVCCSYIKKQSISHLFNKVQQVMEHDDPGFGIFTLNFDKKVGENGVYYAVDFDWRSRHGRGAARSRESDEETKQLDLIGAFMSSYQNQLIDMEGIRDMTCVDGWEAQKIQALTEKYRELEEAEVRSLPAA